MKKQWIKIWGVMIGLVAGLSLGGQTLNLIDTTCMDLITKKDLEDFLDNSGNSKVTLTRCPERVTPQLGMVWSFTNFTKDPRDSLIFYNGPDITSDRIGAVQEIAGNEIDFVVKASLTNPSGCLTLLYEPNINSNMPENWELSVSCGIPCQDFEVNVNLLNASSYYTRDQILTICPDENFSLEPSFIFSNNNEYYTQSAATIQTFWSIDGNLIRGNVLDTSFSNSKGYSISAWAIDSNGCIGQAIDDWIVRVSGPPTFIMGDSIPKEICVGESFVFQAQSGTERIEEAVVVSPDSFYFDPIHRITDTIRLPDGDGSKYVSYLRIDDYADNEVIQFGSDLQEICINLEHSFMPDLDVVLKCPSGKEIYLHEQISGNTSASKVYLGSPVDDENTPLIPGQGLDYCWSSNANIDWTNFVQNLPIGGGGTLPVLPSDNYLSSESFNNLIGCKVNGIWELIITDHEPIDNGFLFNWSMIFDERIPNKRSPYQPKIVSLNWQVDTISQLDSLAKTFNLPGNASARLTSTDEFGCSFDTLIDIRVLESSHPACLNCNLLSNPDTIGYCSPDPLSTFFSGKKDTTEKVVFKQDYYASFSTFSSEIIDEIEIVNSSTTIDQICFDQLNIQANGGFNLTLENPSGNSFSLIEWDQSDTLFLSQFCFDPSALSIIPDTNRISGAFRPVQDWSVGFEPGIWRLKVESTNFFADGELSTWSVTTSQNYLINFQWTPSNLTAALSCTDCANPIIDPAQLNSLQNTLTLTASDNLGCRDSTTLTIDSLPTFPPLQIDTFNVGPGRILFKWTEYESLEYIINVSINSSPGGFNVINTNEYLLQNLTPGTSVDIQVALKDPPCPTLPSNFNLNIPCFMMADTANLTPPTCQGSDDGSVLITTQFATSPIFELVGSGNKRIQPFLDSLAPGSYRVLVTDMGCQDTVDFEIPDKAPIEISTSIFQENLCLEDKLAGIKLTAMGGNGDYIYNWTSQGIQADSLTNLAAGDYPLEVKDIVGCTLDTLINITSPDSISVSSAVIVPPQCFGGNDGQIQLTISGGTAPYQFDWGQGSTNSNLLSNLSSGIYCVTITDKNNCSSFRCYEVMDPKAISIDSFTAVDPKCYSGSDGSILAHISGGIGPINYLWSDYNMQSGMKATQLAAGDYQLIVTDALGCLAIDSVRLNQPDSFFLESTITSITCFGDSDGQIEVIGKGGKVPYSFNWSNGDTSYSIENLPAGVYRVTATDGGNCTLTQNMEIPGPLLPLGASFVQAQQGCYGAKDNTVEVTGTGGMGSYQYIWEDSSEGPIISGLDTIEYEVFITDSVGCKDTFAFTPADQLSITPNIITNNPTCVGNKDGKIAAIPPTNDITNYEFLWNTGEQKPLLEDLEGGLFYTLTITYTPTGCKDTLTKFLNPPTDITFEINTTPVSCYGGFDGTAAIEQLRSQDTNFVFTWDFKTGYQNTSRAVGLKVGTYEVIIENGEGCVKTSQVEISSPPPLSIQASTINNLCFGDTLGSLTLSTEGGVAPYSYRWSTGDSLYYLNKLEAGQYEVTVTDANQCNLKEVIEVTEPGALEVEIETKPVVCFGEENGFIDIFPFGGTAPFTYSLDGVNFTSGSRFSGLPSGNYTAWIKDNNGCKSSTSGTVASPPKILLDIGPPSLPLLLGDSVLLEVSIVNGNQPINISWMSSEPDILSCLDCFTPVALPDKLTFIQAMVTDKDGCSASDKITLIVDKNRVIEVPTGFSPNGDGQNDLLLVHGSAGTIIKNFAVYDQWGAIVHNSGDFEVNQTDGGWDGTVRNQLASSGIYLWKVEATFIDGITEIYSGSTTLIR
ncbi:MAG: gliding motility-associated C-terminal domain-containing protein [Saprospiraceae bacterium]